MRRSLGLIMVLSLAATIFHPCILYAAKPPVPLVDDTKLKDAYAAQVGQWLKQGKFNELDAEAERLRTSWERMPGGIPKLAHFYNGFREEIDKATTNRPKKELKEGADSPALMQCLEQGEKWVETKPGSATAKIALAFMYRTTLTKKTTEDLRKKCRTKLWELVDAAEASGVKDPAIYHLRILKAQGDGAELKQIEALLDKALAIQPSYFPCVMEVAFKLAPCCVDDPGLWVDFAERMTEKSRQQEGDGVYARIFWGMMQNYSPWYTFTPDNELYRRNRLSWPRIRQGFRDLNERYPGSLRTLNYFAYYACLAQDWETANELFQTIGDSWDKDVWTYERRYRLWCDTVAPTTQTYQREPWGQISGVAEGIVRAIAFSPNGKTLAIGNSKGMIVLWDMEEQRVRTRWRAHDHQVMSVKFSSDGRILATGNGDYKEQVPSQVKLWDVDSTQEIRAIPTENKTVGCIAFSPDGARLAAAASFAYSKKGTIYVHNLAEKSEQHIKLASGRPVTCAFSPANPSLLAFNAWENLGFWDVAANKAVATDIIIPYGPEQVAPRGSKRDKCNVCIYIHSMAFNSDGSLLALGRTPTWEKREYAGHATLFDMNKMQMAEVQPQGDMGGIRGLAFTPDDKYLVGGGYDTYVYIWDVKTGREVTQLYGHTDVIETLAISADGRFLATGAMDHIVRLWDLKAILKKVAAQPEKSPSRD